MLLNQSMIVKCIFILAFLGLSVGCETPAPLDPLLSHYVLAVDEWGRPLNPGNALERVQLADYDMQVDGLLNNIQEWQNAGLKDDQGLPKRNKILIFVHGGMNSPGDALQRADDDFPKVVCENIYPIYINWNSEPISSYREHLLYIRQGQVEASAVVTWPLYLFADLARALARGPAVWVRMIGHDTNLYQALASAINHQDQNRRFTDNIEEREAVLLTDYLHSPSTRPSIDLQFGEYVGTAELPITELPRYLALYWCKLLLAPPLDALGKPAWENMYRRTSVLFEGVSANHFADELIRPQKIVTPEKGTLVRFLEKLETFQKAHPDYEITLVGHSMGAIVLDELVRRSRGHVYYKSIVYMAAACSVRDFQRCVIPYMVDQDDPKITDESGTSRKTDFYNLCLHPVNDLRELAYYDAVPRGSLLVWIDDFLSEPGTPLDRVMGRWDNIVEATYVIPKSLYARIHLKAFKFKQSDQLRDNPNDPSDTLFEQNPQRHGQFTQIRYWDSNLWTKPLPPSPASPAKHVNDLWNLIYLRALELRRETPALPEN